MSTVAEEVAHAGRVRGFLRLVVIEHSVFALPFVLIAVSTATADIDWLAVGYVVVALVAARTFAMAANRVIDRELDARNPRTAQRELVTGALPVSVAYGGMAVALAVFLVAAWALNPLCLALSPVALAPLTLYPYAKRFTWLCHYVLGLAQAMAPIGTYVALRDGIGGVGPGILLGLAVGTWIAGFDLIYACQDIDSDRATGVHSLPARFGAAAALRVSAVTHVATVALLVAYGAATGSVGRIWYAGVALAAAALAYEHAIVKPDDLSRVNRAFFTVNGWIGLGLMLFAAAELVW
ncbi:MAG TPA: 4-hydroxybenzoate octaprenyltransferase [Mycobacteriales bacterium]|nr:4-hydroxybenzoate octaprenyltransferase [Mycobacteriales bacterium]